MLSAYQAELCEDMNTKPDPEVWERITVLTDICLRVQRCAVQATAKAMGMMKITFLGLNLDSGSFTAHLSTPRMNALSLCLARFRLHSSVRFALCLRLLDPVRHSRSGSFCLQGECSVSTVFLPARLRRSTRRGRAGAQLATETALRFSPSGPDTTHLAEGTNPAPHSHSGGPILASHALGGGHFPTPGGPTLETAASQGPGVPSGRLDLPPSSRTAGPVGLAPEGCGLVSAELPQAVIRTIQNARAPSTRSLYDCKWRVFEAWCQGREVSPFQCPVNIILSFLQDLLDGKKAFSTIKVYLAAISARHLGFGKKLAGRHPLVCSFMRGARRLLPVSRPLVPSWDLSLVLSALSGPPFEPMDSLDLKILSLKVVLLLALVSAK
ncbi:uncharacterized protein [Nothobranchius furzeri]|uniref:uncharacterized protein n=1 Tax=Nothobranchius furzeri TaxID=105023 RepID=UPI003904B66B